MSINNQLCLAKKELDELVSARDLTLRLVSGHDAKSYNFERSQRVHMTPFSHVPYFYEMLADIKSLDTRIKKLTLTVALLELKSVSFSC